MSTIDIPALKQILWQEMRDDLKSFVPWFADRDLLLCPACCRALKYDDFSLEHIIPQQALALDPLDVRSAIPKGERSGITLLCKKQLVYRGRRIPGNGCNGWKGKYYDNALRDLIHPNIRSGPVTSRHQIALFIAGYLGLFRKFGYQIALSQSGRLMREQYFNPNSFLRNVPPKCQMMLAGEPLASFDEALKTYWDEPFKFTVESTSVIVVVRSMGFAVPISHDPTQPIARSLRYAPSKYILRPDFATAFE